MRGGEQPPNLFVCGYTYEEVDDIHTLMESQEIEDHHLAIDALRQWCFFIEDHTQAPIGKNFRDTHHWYKKPGMRGCPKAIYRNLDEHKDLLRRDVHEFVEWAFGWMHPLHTSVVTEYLGEC